MAYGVYSAQLAATAVSTARTLVQVNAPATAVLLILRAWVSQTLSETATQEEIQLLRVTTAGTGTSATPRPYAGYAASGATATVDHSAEGTAGDSLIREGWEIRAGWLWVPSDLELNGEGIIVPPSGRIALKFPVAPTASITVSAGITFKELS